MKDLMQRTDGPAIRDTVIWLGLLVVAGAGGVLTWGTWAAVPFFLVYGVLYGSVCDSRWHECGHGTAFRTPWMNDAVYLIASFMVMPTRSAGAGATPATTPIRSLSDVTRSPSLEARRRSDHEQRPPPSRSLHLTPVHVARITGPVEELLPGGVSD
jgi:hypothetical protein